MQVAACEMKRSGENDGENWASSSEMDDAGCSQSKRDDHVSEEILDMLDLESDPPSGDEDDISDPVLEPKHEIFLSHSGQQKDFTELLLRELERWGYNSFFDIRDDSIPKGKKFPELIFRAASQCRVAVLILSEEFFTKTKWPMLELAAFVDAQEKSQKQKRPELCILPVYLGLTREECKKNANIERWQKRWEEMENMEMAEKMKEMDEFEKAETQAQYEAARERGELRSQKWKDTMKVLGPSNGIEYEQSSRQAGLIDRVVSAVRHLLKPTNMASDPSCQAKGRICKSLIEMISKTRASSNGARVVGVYGMGGMGKTTFCKELCCELYEKFVGKVCHAELGSLSEIKLQRKVVEKLTDVNHCSLSLAEDSKVTDYVRTHMAREKVFLAVDNVWPESKGEAIVYVEQARYGKGSIVMVTARSMNVLLLLGIGSDDCFAMPELDEMDARRLFLHHAAPDFQSRGSEDEAYIRHCIYECCFMTIGRSGKHFLPLALKVLGQQMHNMGGNPRKWVESLSKDKDKFNMDRRKEHPIFFILSRGYDLLQAEDQILFMDAVLCNPDWKQKCYLRFFCTRWTLFEWLSIVHYGTTSKESLIRDRLQALKERAFLEDIGDGIDGVYVHDLYLEFAILEASRDVLDARRVVWHFNPANLPKYFKEMPGGNCWSHVERVGIRHQVDSDILGVDLPLDRVKWQHFANVVVLEVRTSVRTQVLDLRGLKCLTSLVVCARESTIIGLGMMEGLGWLDLDGVCCGPDLEEIGDLTELQRLWVWTFCFLLECFERPVPTPPCLVAGRLLNVEKSINLREVVVGCRCLQALPDLGGMKYLRKIEFVCSLATKGLGGLGSKWCHLQELVLNCNSLRGGLDGLHEVVTLQKLEVRGFPELEVFPDIRMLTKLQFLYISSVSKLVLILGLGELVALEFIGLNRLPKLRELPNMRLLTKLQTMTVGEVEVWEQLELLDMVPSQLRCFNFDHPRGCELSYNTFGHVDLHEWYKRSSATMLRDINPMYPRWGKPQML